jgi:tetratricopeptide (TPR) repeat protein
VAAGWAVNDVAAVVFARTFYQHMLDGRKFGEAVKEARVEARRSGSNTWSAYQCYGNPDFMLTEPGGRVAVGPREFYSRREWLDELKDIAASAGGRRGHALKDLTHRIQAAEAIPGAWRDGEALVALAECQKAVGDFDAAMETYKNALQLEKANAPVQAIEQRANLKDRRAGQLFRTDPVRANQMWDDAEGDLIALNKLLGQSSERLSLLGGLWKRRGRADLEKRTDAFKKAVEYYRSAYLHARITKGEIDPYPGLNLIALSYLNGEKQPLPNECLEEAKRSRDDPNFWERIYLADAILLEHLLAGTLGPNAEEVISAYQNMLRFAPPDERDSVLGQLQFIAEMSPSDPELQRVVREATL